MRGCLRHSLASSYWLCGFGKSLKKGLRQSQNPFITQTLVYITGVGAHSDQLFMGEKGGNGFSLPKGGKSSLKSPAAEMVTPSHNPKLTNRVSLKGKDGNSAKSKKGRKVQFDSEEPKISTFSKSGGKADVSVAKGDVGKGGKGDKIANGGGKSPAAKESSTKELKLEQELPKNAKFLMDCEAKHILQGIQEQMVILSEDPTIRIPVSFHRGLEYAKSSCHYKSPQSVREILEPLKEHGASDCEICMIANVCPESVNEAFALIPSLKGKKSKLKEPLKDVLSELAMLKSST